MGKVDLSSAFPVNSANLGEAGAYPAQAGMTLRDYFAGQALLNIRVGPPAQMAQTAYAIADAMMVARYEGIEAFHG